LCLMAGSIREHGVYYMVWVPRYLSSFICLICFSFIQHMYHLHFCHSVMTQDVVNCILCISNYTTLHGFPHRGGFSLGQTQNGMFGFLN
jgi:hypothetical protein